MDDQTLIVKSIQNIDWEDEGFVKHLLSASGGKELSHLNKVASCTLWEFVLDSHLYGYIWGEDNHRTVVDTLLGNEHIRSSLAFVDVTFYARAISDGSVANDWPPDLLSKIVSISETVRTTSTPNVDIGHQKPFAKSIQSVDWEDEDFLKHLLSASGGEELSHLNKQMVCALWKFVLHNYGIWGEDNHRTVAYRLFGNKHMRKGLRFFEIFGFAKIITDDTMNDWPPELLSKIILMGGTTEAGDVQYDDEGDSLLHCIAYNFSMKFNTHVIIRLIHDVIPHATTYTNSDGEHPLHTAVRLIMDRPDVNNENLRLSIRAFLEGDPTTARQYVWDWRLPFHDGRLPFHNVCLSSKRFDCSFFDIARELYEAHPNAIREKIYLRPSKIHFFEFIMHGVFRRITSRHPVLPFLFEKFPEGLMKKDYFGFVPFQVIESCSEASTLLKEQFLDKIEQSDNLMGKIADLRDEEGNNLLHVLANRTVATCDPLNRFNLKTTQQVFKWIIKTFPNYVTEKNAKGELPVHLLLKNDDDQYTKEELTSLVNIMSDELCCAKKAVSRKRPRLATA